MNKSLVIIAFLILILFNAFWLVKYHISDTSIGGEVISMFDTLWGSITSVANIFVEVVSSTPNITIYSPQNTTYYFTVSTTLDINLSVGANQVIQAWWYDLYNSSNSLIYDDVIFPPNTTFTAVYGSNKIFVYGNVSTGGIGSANVTFNARYYNATPSISIPSEHLACEESSFSYRFNVTDADEGTIVLSLSPTNPFFVSKISASGNRTVGEVFSAYLPKSRVGNYSELLSASDGEFSDTKRINITVLEINHRPNITAEAKTIWPNETLYYQIYANDMESGNSSSGNLTFNISFISGAAIFSINSSHGIINFTSNDSIVGNYNLSVCSIDRGIGYHQNLTFCSANANISLFNCSSFSLTITNENRAPNITSYYPSNESILSASTADYVYFNATANDPDGTTPTITWYLDSSTLVATASSLNYSASLIGLGSHTITALASDGSLNDSVIWRISVASAPRGASTGGGGGGGGKTCVERWVCNETRVCQSLSEMLSSGILDSETKTGIELKCLESGWGGDICGAKVVECIDLNDCGTKFSKPTEIKHCYYTAFPSCNDKVKNCHDGDCEVLIDCGGPCGVCPTCDDGIQNQGESGIDCGGPCPTGCPEIETPKKQRNYLTYVFIGLILLLLIAIIIAVRYLIKIKKRLDNEG